MTPEQHAHDLAISAVAYDTLLVQEITGALLAARLRSAPVWSGASPVATEAEHPLHRDVSRVVLVLAQRLWGHDVVTAADEAILKDRVRRSGKSIIVVTLDDAPLPSWMESLPRRDLSVVGVDGVVEFVTRAIAATGGIVQVDDRRETADSPQPAATSRWPEPPTPFLGQPRAFSGLRRELDALCEELSNRIDAIEDDGGQHLVELHRLPHRFIARYDDVGVSFSWVPGRAGTVADGRLMVIEWRDIERSKGIGALRTAHPAREHVYTAEATNAEDWRWRADGPNGRASSTHNLASEWMDGATLANPTT